MPTRPSAPPPMTAANPIELRPRGDFVAWLAAAGGALAVTTYNSGKLALFRAADNQLRASYWKFPRPMGLAVADDRLGLATRHHIWLLRLQGALELASPWAVDAIYATGRLDAHDLAFDRRGLLFANTRFNCVARPSDRVHFRRLWQPPFMAEPVAKDCCHLNGVGVRGGRLAMATAFCQRSTPSAWRDGDRFHSGVLIDVRRNVVVAEGLCLPHSPRWHAGRWWFCNSGEGTLESWDDRCGQRDSIAALPGFARGLSFAAGRAIVGLSRIRKRHVLDAPPVRGRFPRMRSGVSLVDSKSGCETGSLEFVRGGREVYDVAFLPTQ